MNSTNYLEVNLFQRLIDNPNDICFYQKKKNIKNIEFLNDIKKRIAYFKSLKLDGKILIFSLPSYGFYVSLISLMYLGCEVVIVEGFKDKVELSKMLEACKCKYILVNKKTKIFSYFIKPFNNLIRIKDYGKCDKKLEFSSFEYSSFDYSSFDYSSFEYSSFEYSSIDYSKKILYTFSSGTSSYKVISRSLNDLILQFDLVKDSFNVNFDRCVCLMVMYVLVNLLNNVKCYLPKTFNAKGVNKEFKYIKENNIDTLIASVSRLVKIESSKSIFSHVYTGGSKISYNDRIKLLDKFGNLTYMYGSSEVTVISVTDLLSYHKALENFENCVGKNVNKVDVKIVNNEVLVKTLSGLSKDNDGYFHTGDLGYLKDGYLYLTGKANYTKSDVNQIVLEDRLDRIFKTRFTYLYYKDKHYIIYDNKKLKLTSSEIKERLNLDFDCTVINRKTKKDIRHSYKQNYRSCIKVIEKYGK